MFRQKQLNLEKDSRGYPLMNAKNLKQIIIYEDLYQTQHLNTKLYLQQKDFSKIENLEAFTDLRALYLNNNVIQKIEGLEHLENLICLYLNNNIITKIENIGYLKQLTILNLGHNLIQKIEGIENLPKLNNLQLNNNKISSSENIEGLLMCPSITSLDLSSNEISEDQNILDVFSKCKNLACLYLRGNEFQKRFVQYRRKFISGCKQLMFLDDRPIFTNERRLAEAWCNGGPDAEKQERFRIYEDTKRKNQKTMNDIKDTYQKGIEGRQNNFKEFQKQIDEEKIKILQAIEKVKAENLPQEYIDILEQEFDQQEQKLIELTEKYDEIPGLKIDPYQYWSASRNKDGSMVIHNKKPEEAEHINKSFYGKGKQNSLGTIFLDNFQLEMKQTDKVNPFDTQRVTYEIENETRKQWGLGPKIADTLKEQEIKKQLEDLDDVTKFSINIDQLKKRWLEEYDEFIEAILIHFCFDFEQSTQLFNQIVEEKLKQQNIDYLHFNEYEIRQMWTYIESKLRKQYKKGDSTIHEQVVELDRILDNLDGVKQEEIVEKKEETQEEKKLRERNEILTKIQSFKDGYTPLSEEDQQKYKQMEIEYKTRVEMKNLEKQKNLDEQREKQLELEYSQQQKDYLDLEELD